MLIDVYPVLDTYRFPILTRFSWFSGWSLEWQNKNGILYCFVIRNVATIRSKSDFPALLDCESITILSSPVSHHVLVLQTVLCLLCHHESLQNPARHIKCSLFLNRNMWQMFLCSCVNLTRSPWAPGAPAAPASPFGPIPPGGPLVPGVPISTESADAP